MSISRLSIPSLWPTTSSSSSTTSMSRPFMSISLRISSLFLYTWLFRLLSLRSSFFLRRSWRSFMWLILRRSSCNFFFLLWLMCGWIALCHWLRSILHDILSPTRRNTMWSYCCRVIRCCSWIRRRWLVLHLLVITLCLTHTLHIGVYLTHRM